MVPSNGNDKISRDSSESKESTLAPILIDAMQILLSYLIFVWRLYKQSPRVQKMKDSRPTRIHQRRHYTLCNMHLAKQAKQSEPSNQQTKQQYYGRRTSNL